MYLNRDIEKILDITISLSNETDYEHLLERILEDAMEISNCDGGTLYLLTDEGLEFFFMITKSLGIRSGGLGKKINLPPVDINSSSVASLCARTKKIINVEDVYKDKEHNWSGPIKYDALTGYHTKSVLVLPLLDKDKNVLGVMQLINAKKDNEIVPFSNDLERIIYSLSSLSGVLMNNMQLYDEIKSLLYSFVNAMVKTIESRTPYNAFHTVNVAKICIEFSKYLIENTDIKLSNQQIEELNLAAMLHDVGKIVIPLEILNKATRFEGKIDKMLQRYDLILASIKINYLSNIINEEEYKNEYEFVSNAKEFIIKLDKSSFLSEDDKAFINIMKDKIYNTEFGDLKLFNDDELDCALIARGTLTASERLEIEKHVVYTNEILKDIKFGKKYKNVINIASSHHEYLNGSGYPNHLTEKDLPTLVRIITIADIFESLVSTDRPYKKPMPVEKALSILNEMALKEGKLDKDLVKYFIEFKGAKQ